MSTPAPAPRLTKKQQKAAAHKKGVRKGKGKGKQAEDAAGDLLDVPEDDLGQEEAGEELAKPSKKRKRAAEDDDNDAEADADADGTDGEPKKKLTRNQQKRKANRDRKQRFIVFVGNLPYKVTQEDIIAHFAEACGETPSVRLLTSRDANSNNAERSEAAEGEDPGSKKGAAPKTKGCAFLEFSSSHVLQQALHLHQSQFKGSLSSTKRKINVELTAGGGGNGEHRLNKLAESKDRLEKQREKHKTVEDEEKAKRDEEKVKVREEWKRQQAAQKKSEASKPFKERKSKLPKWLSGTNAVKLG